MLQFNAINLTCFFFFLIFYRDFRPTSLEKGQELCRLRIYEVYAWGVPLLISGVAAILDNLPETPGDTFLRPRFGQNRCWFFGKSSIFIFSIFYPVISVVVFMMSIKLLELNFFRQLIHFISHCSLYSPFYNPFPKRSYINFIIK